MDIWVFLEDRFVPGVLGLPGAGEGAGIGRSEREQPSADAHVEQLAAALMRFETWRRRIAAICTLTFLR